jgi:hypothetical protein
MPSEIGINAQARLVELEDGQIRVLYDGIKYALIVIRSRPRFSVCQTSDKTWPVPYYDRQRHRDPRERRIDRPFRRRGHQGKAGVLVGGPRSGQHRLYIVTSPVSGTGGSFQPFDREAMMPSS